MAYRLMLRYRVRSYLTKVTPFHYIFWNYLKSDRGTWTFEVAATYVGKVRTPCDGGHMSQIRAPKVCGLFKPGHDPHWIQMSQATEDIVNLRWSP